MPFDVKMSGFRNNFPPLAIIKTMKSQWKFHPWEASIGINQDHMLLISLSYISYGFGLTKDASFYYLQKNIGPAVPKMCPATVLYLKNNRIKGLNVKTIQELQITYHLNDIPE